MAKVLIFSREFPNDHPRAGQRTMFVEKVLNGLGIFPYLNPFYLFKLWKLNRHSIKAGKISFMDLVRFFFSLNFCQWKEKIHTVRKSDYIKDGDEVSPRVWTGKPYQSPQIIFAQDTKVGTQEITFSRGSILIDGQRITALCTAYLCQHDGLDYSDFSKWHTTDFTGQIIHFTSLRYDGQNLPL